MNGKKQFCFPWNLTLIFLINSNQINKYIISYTWCYVYNIIIHKCKNIFYRSIVKVLSDDMIQNRYNSTLSYRRCKVIKFLAIKGNWQNGSCASLNKIFQLNINYPIITLLFEISFDSILWLFVDFLKNYLIV